MAKRGRRKATEDNNIFVNRSYKNLLYGAATVLVLFVAVFLGLNLMQKAGTLGGPGIETERTQDERTYTVQEGDTLWSISQKIYNDAYQWPKLAEANKMISPDVLEKGTKLVIPDLPKTQIAQSNTPTPTKATAPTSEPTAVPTRTVPTATPMESDARPGSKGALAPTAGPTELPVPGVEKITGGSYTVVEGDNLWDIAVRKYGDGYRWVDIAKANNLPNPDLIYPGSKFTLPR
jgi:nucleoid-associated protein YgaU